MGWLQSLAVEFPITLANGTVWLSIGQGLALGAVCLLFGVWLARFVGLLRVDAPAGETFGVGLASGLVVLTSWWAAIASSGRSSFTSVAVGFVVAVGLAVVRRRRQVADDGPLAAPGADAEPARSSRTRHRDLLLATLGGAAFVAAVALLYGSTMAPSPRDGVQPIEFSDEAYYSVLGADLAKTGTESLYSPSGLTDSPTPQTWYHWGELWLASFLITMFGSAPLQARHLAALPILLLAVAAVTGTLVRRVTGSTSRSAYLFGFFTCLFLAPVPLIPGPFFSTWAVGMIFAITLYGLAAVAVLLTLYGVSVLERRAETWALEVFVGSAAALIVPAHLAIALLALVGIGSVWTIRIVHSLTTTHRLPEIGIVWRRTYLATGLIVVATVAWGLATGHGVGTSWLSSSVSPFNDAWRDSVAIVVACSGAFLAIAIAWFLIRDKASIEAGLYVGTGALLVAGAIAWGARLGDLNVGHLFFGGIAVFATPVAAIAVWSIWRRLRDTGHRRLGVVVLLFCVAQLEFGIGLGITRLQIYGPGSYPPIPLATLAAIGNLPTGAKLAYACGRFEEASTWAPQLLSLAAHSGRRFVPMCFQAETFPALFGKTLSPDVMSPLFESAPQRGLYPDSEAQPSSAAILAFLKSNGIGYIYTDARHLNSLMPDAVPIAPGSPILRLP